MGRFFYFFHFVKNGGNYNKQWKDRHEDVKENFKLIKCRESKKKMSIVFRMCLSLYDLKQVDIVMD